MVNFESGPDKTKPYQLNATNRSVLPGYQNAYLEFLNLETGETKIVGFMVSPNSVSMNMSNTQQVSRTSAGWAVMRGGKNMQNIGLTGYLLDSKHCQERHDFVEKYYKKYIEDRKNANNEYISDWAVSLVVEGKKYIGFIQSLNMQKSSVQPFLYQYSISYISIDDILIYTSSESEMYRQTPSASATPNFVGASASSAMSEAVLPSVMNLVSTSKTSTTSNKDNACGIDFDNERRYLKKLIDNGTPGEKAWALEQARKYNEKCGFTL